MAWWRSPARSITSGLSARTVRDAALLLETMAGRDECDATSAFAPLPDYTAQLDGEVSGTQDRLAARVFRRARPANRATRIQRRPSSVLKKLGCEVRDISLPATKYAVPCYYIIATAEASSNLARYDGVRYTTRAE